jgi:topoisomerase-4 subunit A
VKGFKALGNQLTTEKIKQVNILESLPYEVPQENAGTQMMMGQIFNG